MRTWSRPTIVSLSLVSGLALAGDPAMVDFRMAPLEQVKKINQALVARHGSGETRTLMLLGNVGEGQHMIISRADSEAGAPAGRLAGLDSVSWYVPPETKGSCDSLTTCEEKVAEMCTKAGYGGVKKATVTVTVHADGSKTCSGDCSGSSAVAFVTCNR